jgi:hypothetical protein
MTRHWMTATIGSILSLPVCEGVAWIEGWTVIPAVTYALLFSFGVTATIGIWRS